jgi:MFS transporter, DHA1 family, multidrug resistance protein
VKENKTISMYEVVALMAALMMINAMAIDIMLPALPMIGESLGVTNENHRQYIVSAYLVGFAISQLFYGPLADRFGRRKPMIFGLVIYILGAVAGAFSTTFAMLLFWRAIQGIGAASTRVISMSIVRDIYGGRKMAEVMSMIMMVFLLGPIVAPGIGQAIIAFYSWRLIFAAMGVFGFAVLMWLVIRLPETLKKEDVRAFQPAIVLQGFRIVLTNHTAFYYTLASAFMFGAIFSFINSASQIYIELYNLGDRFALAFAGVAGCMSLASYLNSRFVGRFGMRRLSHSSLIGYIAVTTIWLTVQFFSTQLMPLWIFLAFFATAMFLFGWIAANFNSLAMEPLGHVAGTASSVLGFITTLGGGAIGAFVGQMYNGSATPLIAGFVGISVSALICVLIAERGQLLQPHNQPTD